MTAVPRSVAVFMSPPGWPPPGGRSGGSPVDRQADVVGQPRRAVDADRSPTETTGRSCATTPAAPSRCGFPLTAAVEFGHAPTAATQQFTRPPQHPPRVTAEPDVAVGQQHRLPAAGARQRIEHVAAQGRRAAAPRQFDGGGRLVDTERRHAALDQVGHQTSRAATQVDRRAVAQPDHGVVELLVGVAGRRASCAPAAGARGRRRGGSSSVHRPARGRRDCPARHTPAATCRTRKPTLGRTCAPDDVDIVDGVHIRQLCNQVHVYTGVAQCRQRYSAGVRARHRNRPQAVGHGRRRSRRAPTSRRRGPCPAPRRRRAVPARIRRSGRRSPAGCPSRSAGPEAPAAVAASTCALASRSAKSSPRCSTTVKSANAIPDFGAAAGPVQVAGQRDHPVLHRRGGDRVEGVQQRGGGDVGGGLITDGGRQPGLRLPGHRRLGHHQHRHRVSRDHPPKVQRRNDTAAKRSADLRLAAGARPVGDVALDHAPARLRPHAPAVPAGSPIGGRSHRARAGRRGGRPASARCRAPAARSGCAAASTPPRCPAARATASAGPAPVAVARSPCRRRGRVRRPAPAAHRRPATRRRRGPPRSASSPPLPRHAPPSRSPAAVRRPPVRRGVAPPSAVSSVLLLSTTSGRYPSGMAASTPGSDAASLRQGSTTVTGQSGIPPDGRPGTTPPPADEP